MERNKIAALTIILLLLSLAQRPIQAQELIFEKNPGRLTDHPAFGPNRKHFFHPFFSSALILPSSSAKILPTNVLFTGNIAVGLRYKYKFSGPLSMIAESGAHRNFYKLNQNPGKQFPDTVSHRSQTVGSAGMFGGLYLRLRLGQRGDYLGNYIDLGISAQANLLNKLVTKDLIYPEDPHSHIIEKTNVSALKWINPFTYKALMRVGFDRYALTASYRISRLLSIDAVKDLPAFEIGIEISPVRY